MRIIFCFFMHYRINDKAIRDQYQGCESIIDRLDEESSQIPGMCCFPEELADLCKVDVYIKGDKDDFFSYVSEIGNICDGSFHPFAHYRFSSKDIRKHLSVAEEKPDE